MPPNSTSDQDAVLKTWVQHDKRIVTYRLLSRELRIHVTDAKAALASFFDAHKSEGGIDATYILIGTPKPQQPNDGELLDKVKQEDGEAKIDEDGDANGDDQKQSGDSTSTPVSLTSRRDVLGSRITDRQTSETVDRQTIKLVCSSQLAEAKSAFESISSCHIYSLSPGVLRDAAQLTAVQHELHSTKKYVEAWQQTNRGADLGAILNSSIRDNYDPSKALPSLAAPSVPALAKKGSSSEDKDTKAQTAASKGVKAEPPPAAAAAATSAVKQEKPDSTSKSSSGAGKKGGLDWSRAKPKAAEKPAPAATGKSSAQAKSNGKPRHANSRKALLGSEDEEEDYDGDKDAESMDVDNDDDDDDDDGKPVKLGYNDDEGSDDDRVGGGKGVSASAKAKAPRGSGKRADAHEDAQTSAQREAQRKELEAMMDMDDDFDLDPPVPIASETSTSMMKGTSDSKSATAAAAPKERQRVRKKRKIGTKKVRSKDERGYTVTQMVDEYESYSSDESAADDPVIITGSTKRAPASKAQPKNSKTETNKSTSTSTSASASPAPAPAPAPASSKNSKTTAAATPPVPPAASSNQKKQPTAPAKKGQQSLNSFFTRKPKDK
ncbi:hypothetical protein BCV70DRAFT_197999 [Testicularia cyperi]|uniref:DNA polymerase delta subunit 3 n=1 Tax=Testicularia cyperi TaxID=1882483 RepID=A0A317XZT5_9BASI|nr:hypothetical protein BCV70DRAFT_197999 [Testicularia cyperi]